jgi:AraC-like DNA-binding protein
MLLVKHNVMSTREVTAEKRVEYWIEMLSSTYVNLESSAGSKQDFYGCITKTTVGQLDLSRVQTTSPLVRRTPRLIRQLHDECILVHCAHTGFVKVEQMGRSAQVGAGDITVYLSTEPYDLIFNEWSDTRVLRIPLAVIKPYVRNLEDLTAKVIPRASVEASMLHGMMASLWNGRMSLSNSSVASVSDALVQVTAAGLQASSNLPNHRASNLDAYYVAKAKEVILHDIRKASLNTETVAAAVGISSRHLARLFECEALSVSRMIWIERLEGCKRELARSGRSKRTIDAVAYSWGFSSASHFSRSFRSRFGMSPSEYLAQLS